MSNSVNYNNIPSDRPASWKQKVAINTRVGLLVAEADGVELDKPIRQAVSKILTNKLTHGEVQKYFKIESITDIDGKVLKDIKDVLEGKPVAKKATAKKAKETKSSSNNDEMMQMMKLMMQEIADIKDDFSSKIDAINSHLDI